MPFAVEVSDLEKRFGKFVAVNGVSFAVEEGEVFGFLGPNGSGKSTTIRMLCGLLLPSRGSGTVAGLDITRQAELIRTQIGYMPQLFSLYTDLTVGENLRFYAGLYSVPTARARERIEQVTGRLELTGMMDRLAGTLSTGWRQRLALASSVLHQPPILFLDEPTSGVDPVTRRLFWEFIDDLAEDGATIFVTTHVMDEAEHCTRLAMMHYGNLIAQGTPEQMRREYVGSIVEVRAEPLWDAVEALIAADDVGEVALFGDALHAECTPEVTDPEGAIRQVLQSAGIAVGSATGVEPTMEDVFVSLARSHERPDEVGRDST